MSSKSLIILEDRSQIDKLISLATGKPTLIALNSDVGQELASRGVAFKTPEDYGLLQEYLQEEGLKWFRSFPNIKVKDNKNVKEIIVHDGLSVWWWLEGKIYLNRFVFPRVMDIIKQAIMLNRIIKAEEPTMVFYANNDTLASRVTEFISKSRNIARATVSYPSGIKWPLPQNLKALVFIYGQWLRMFLRKMYWMLLAQRYRSRKLRGRRKILIFSGVSWENVYDLVTGEMRRGDPYFDSVIELLWNDNEIVFVDIPTSNWGLSTMKEKQRQQKIICKPLECYLNMGVILKALKASKNLHRDYEYLSRLASFRDSLNYDGLPVYDLVKQNLSLFLSRQYLAMLIATVEAAKRMVEIEKPEAIMLGGESFTAGRAIIASAKSKAIPTLLLQHGYYNRYQQYYNHIEADIGPNKEASAPYCPIPDKFAMSDGYTKDILVRYGKIPEADVVVTGQPRYDILARGDKLFNRERTFRRLNLDPRRKLIVWTALTEYWTSSVNEMYVTAVYEAVKSLKDVQLLIKLHPNENKNSYRTKKVYCNDKSFKPLIIGGWGAITYELLYASDIVITHFSTTAVEALTIGKPVIVLNFAGEVVPVHAERGASLYVDEEDTLLPAIKNLLYNEEALQKLGEARDRFISEGNYRQSGLASQKVADLITQMLEDSKKVKEQQQV